MTARVGIAVILVGVAAGCAVTAAASSSSPGPTTKPLFQSAQAGGGATVAIGRGVPLRPSAGVSRWAPVLRPAMARSRPGGRPLVPVSATTPEGTANIVLVTGAREWHGHVWAHVRLAALPNGQTGWLPRSGLGGYTFVPTHLIVDTRTLRATLLRNGKPLMRVPVGVGAIEAPTPHGEFYIRDRLTEYASPFYGPIAFGTSARSAVLTDWPDGGYIGIHGTNRPGLIPGRISHGCVRMRNRDIRRLAQLMPIGTPVTIR